MEEKIKEILSTLSWCDDKQVIEDLVRLFEQEKKAYAEQMCWKAWKEAALVTDRTKDIEESLYTSWQNENFPNP